MDDLISRTAAIKGLLSMCPEKTEPGSFDEYGVTVLCGAVDVVIKGLPAVDAVPVVRCRDCKYGKLCLDADGHRLIQCTNTKYPTANVETWPLELDWYCAGGERRDDDALSGR
jgi:hypothetical protein